jgi:hypothetical protein
MGGGGGLVYVAISPHNPQELYAATDMSAVSEQHDLYMETTGGDGLLVTHNLTVRAIAYSARS